MRNRLPFFIIVIAITIGLNAYIGWHVHALLSYWFGEDFPSLLYWIVFWIVALSYIIAAFGGRVLPKGITQPLKIIGAYWFAFMEYGLLLLLVTDVAIGICRLASVSPQSYIPVLGWVNLAAMALILARGTYNARTPVVRRYDLTIPKEAGEWKELRIAVASDLHLGLTVGNRHLRKLVSGVNAMKPDLIVLPGDVIDDSIHPFIRNRMGETMRGLQAPLGVYAVLGNHEYIGGHIQAYVEQMEQIGVRVLMDEVVHLAERLYLVGRKDKAAEQFAGGRKPLASLMADVDLTQPVIVLDHQPYHLDKAAEAGADVMLSGHTHRGQMAPNHLITRRLFELDWGYLRKGNLHAIVSSGFGTWGPPIRFGSRSEWIALTLHFTNEIEKGRVLDARDGQEANYPR
ncbi:metallophosphoesterase [Paenibacillus oryzisoli]|uniref:metallophosphoesterase n=1 Tax=Paenibacillus oryzisoli TaxID=1850517 RepID=UPI003D2AAD1F